MIIFYSGGGRTGRVEVMACPEMTLKKCHVMLTYRDKVHKHEQWIVNKLKPSRAKS